MASLRRQAAAAVAGLALLAAAAPAAASAVPAAHVTTLLVAYPTGVVPPGLLAEFAQAHPAVRVVAETAPAASYEAALARWAAAGQAPALWLDGSGAIAAAGQEGRALDLRPALRGLSPGSYALLGYPSSGGHVWGVVGGFEPVALAYDRAAFAAAHLPLPSAGWTWARMLGAARALARRPGACGLLTADGATGDGLAAGWLPFAWAYGGLVLSAESPGDLAQAASAAARGTSVWERLRQAGVVCAVPASEVPAAFAQGRAAMAFLTYGQVARVAAERPRFPWAVVPLPETAHGRVAPVVVDSWAVASRIAPAAQEAALAFLRWWLGPTTQEALARSGLALPAWQGAWGDLPRPVPGVPTAFLVGPLAPRAVHAVAPTPTEATAAARAAPAAATAAQEDPAAMQQVVAADGCC